MDCISRAFAIVIAMVYSLPLNCRLPLTFCSVNTGTDVIINFCGKIDVFGSNYCYFLQKLNNNDGFEKNANFLAGNWRKSQKIVIIASTPGFSNAHFPLLSLCIKRCPNITITFNH
jgi:hypothetical protein